MTRIETQRKYVRKLQNPELRFHDFCIQADYRNLTKNPETERGDYYKNPLMELSVPWSDMLDAALWGDPLHHRTQITTDEEQNPWIWMEKLLLHFTRLDGSSLLADGFNSNSSQSTHQSPHESIEEWDVKVRQAGSLCLCNALTDEGCCEKFVINLHHGTMRAALLN